MTKTDTNRKSRFPRVAGNDMMDVHAVRQPDYVGGPPVTTMVHTRLNVDARGQFAMQCIERWAMVVATPDGEDSAGRQKLRRMNADELVSVACSVSEEAFKQFEARGWTVAAPPYSDMIDAVKDVENGND